MNTASIRDELFRFDMELDLEEDIPAELEEFILLARLGVEDEALRLAQDVLWRHTHHYPVFAEVAGFLAEHRLFGELRTLVNHLYDRKVEFRDREEQEFVQFLSSLMLQDHETHITEANVIDSGFCNSTADESKPLSPTQVHQIELQLKHLTHNRDMSVEMHHYALQYFRLLVDCSYAWETAQIFGLLCQKAFKIGSYSSRDDLDPKSHIKPQEDHSLCAMYKEIMIMVEERCILHLIAEPRGLEHDAEKALALLSAKVSFLGRSVLHVENGTPCQDELRSLVDEINLIMRALFRTLPNPKPRGQLWQAKEHAERLMSGEIVSTTPIQQIRQKYCPPLDEALKEWTTPHQPAGISVAPWIVPFERNPRFTGRETQLAELEEKLFARDHTSKIAITGLGGVGKTQLVLELLYRTKEKYNDCSIIWIPAANTASLHQGYFIAAEQLEIPGHKDEKADVKKLVQSHLSKEDKGHWVLVFDNADDTDMWLKPVHEDVESAQRIFGGPRRLIDYLPKNKRGCIIFTTRDSKAAVKLAQPNIVEVPEISEDAAMKLLQRHLVSPDLVDNNAQNAMALLAELTYLPLAIVQAAAFVNENEITLDDYYSLLLVEKKEDTTDLLSEEFEDDGEYQDKKNPVTTTWLVSFQQIRQRDPLAAEFLSFMACIDPKDIPQDLLPPAPSQIRKISAIGTLTAYSFVSRRPADPTLDLHRLVHLATRNWLRKEGLLSQWTEKTIIRLEEVFPDDDHKNRSVWRMYLPHARQALASNLVSKDEERMALMRKCGNCLYSDGRWDEAEELFVQVMETSKRVLGLEHPDSLTNMANLAGTYRNQGRWREAEVLFVQVMEIRKRMLGPEHPDTLTSMANLASTFRNQGRWKEAEELFVQVMETRKRMLGPEHPSTLTSMTNLASTYRNQGRWREAEELEMQVMETSKRVLGLEHPDTLTSMANLAVTYRNQGRWREAEVLFVQVMEIRKRMLGPEHPDTLTSMANLASTFRNQGRWKEAEELFVQVIVTRKRVLGLEHPDTLTSMTNLAVTYRNQGRWKEAEEMFVQVMETSKRVLGLEHPFTLTSMNNLAYTLKDRDHDDQAIELMTYCMKQCIRVLGPSHHLTQNVLMSLMAWQIARPITREQGG